MWRTNPQFLNQNAAYAQASKMAAQMKAKENAKKKLCKQGSQKRLINPAKTKKTNSSSSLSTDQKLEGIRKSEEIILRI